MTVVTDLRELGKTLESLRESEGKTREEVAQSMRVTEKDIERLERDPEYDPEIMMLHDYARALGLDLKIDMVPLKSR